MNLQELATTIQQIADEREEVLLVDTWEARDFCGGHHVRLQDRRTGLYYEYNHPIPEGMTISRWLKRGYTGVEPHPTPEPDGRLSFDDVVWLIEAVAGAAPAWNLLSVRRLSTGYYAAVLGGPSEKGRHFPWMGEILQKGDIDAFKGYCRVEELTK